jgi:hypothetical protein
LADELIQDRRYVTEDGDEIDTSNLTQHGKAQLANLQFVEEQLSQKKNELQIADSARIVYSSVLKSELSKLKIKK